MAFSQVLDHDHSVQRWLTSALPLVLAPWVTEALAVPVNQAVVPVVPSVTEAAPVLKKLVSPRTQRKRQWTRPLESDRQRQQQQRLSSAGALVTLTGAFHFSEFEPNT